MTAIAKAPARKLEAVVFDMDGVIIDSQPIADRMLLETASRLGAQLTQQEIAELVGAGSRDFWDYVIKSRELPYSIDECRALYSQDDEIAAYTDLKPIPGVIELAKSLKERGVLLGLATTASKKRKEAVLDIFELHGLFDATADEDEVKNLKPDPEVYLMTIDRLGVDTSGCIAIEDSSRGVEAAKNASVRSVQYFVEGRNPRSPIADLHISDFSDLNYEKLLNIRGYYGG